MIKRKYQKHLSSEADEYLGFIVESANRMQQLIDDLIQYARVARENMYVTEVPMETVVQNALKSLRVSIEEEKAEVIFQGLPKVAGDVVQLESLMQNLLSNALKYRSERTPRVEISAEANDTHWLFSVKDNGIGFEAQYSDYIFVIFKRLHARRQYSGTGMGLAICKKIVERHGGRIWADSEVGKGSIFYFTLARNIR
jgi:light-regulated signal transduction histidine kinase (bacteriophytochrome)